MPPDPRPADTDAVFAALAAAHDGLDASQSLAHLSRLVLLLATRLDPAAVLDALDDARADQATAPNSAPVSTSGK